MNINKEIFWGPVAELNIKESTKLLKHNKPVPGVFIIAVSDNKDNMLDIYDSIILLQKHMKTNKQLIVGVAFGKEEALELVRTIIDKIYKITGNANAKEYFNQ